MDDAELHHLQHLALQRAAGEMRVYRLVRMVLRPLVGVAFRPEVAHQEETPTSGGLLVVANHRSVLDSLFLAFAVDRPVHWMAKSELFTHRWQRWLLVRLGVFPVRRGASDQGAVATAREMLLAGGVVGVFPEGTRVRPSPDDPDATGPPRHGAARLAVEAGVPILPIALSGTQRGVLRRALWHQGERVRVQVQPLVTPSACQDVREASGEVLLRSWTEVQEGVSSLEHRRGVAVGAGALGLAGVLLVIRRRRT